MLSTTNMSRYILFYTLLTTTALGFSQNATFISPFRDSTIFIYNVTDSTGNTIGEVEYRLHKLSNSTKGTITQLSRDSNNTLTDSTNFTIEKDSTGFNISSDFFLSPMQRVGLTELNQEKNKKTIFYPSKFELDTLDDLQLYYSFEFDSVQLGTSHIELKERYIEKGEFVQTALGRKYCYKVCTLKREELLFKIIETKIVDWYSNEGLVKREFYVNGLLDKEFLLKKVID